MLSKRHVIGFWPTINDYIQWAHATVQHLVFAFGNAAAHFVQPIAHSSEWLITQRTLASRQNSLAVTRALLPNPTTSSFTHKCYCITFEPMSRLALGNAKTRLQRRRGLNNQIQLRKIGKDTMVAVQTEWHLSATAHNQPYTKNKI